MSFKQLRDLLEDITAPKSEGPSSGSARRPVLIVDDDAAMRRSLEILLERDYELAVCASAREGVRAFNSHFLAVILDVHMDEQDGFWACDEIRKIRPDIPIIFYSAYQNLKNPFDIINQHRPFAYITKDGDTQKLRDALEMATRLHQSRIRSERIIDSIRRGRAKAT